MLLFAACIFVLGHSAVGLAVTSISPNYASAGGGTKFSIAGVGIKDQFAGDSIDVRFMAADGESVTCTVFKEETTATTTVCHNKKMRLNVVYNVSVTVDGTVVTDLCTDNPSKCQVMPHWYTTPRVYDVKPQSGKPGDTILTMYGHLYSDVYGSNAVADARILRATATTPCELKNGTEKDDFYGLKIDNDRKGYLVCKPTGTFVGNSNFTFLVESPAGMSVNEWNVTRVASDGSIYTVQFFTDIDSISQTDGSVEGGTLVQLDIDYIEDAGAQSTYTPLRIYVGGEKAEVVSVVKNQHVVIRTPAQSSSKSFYSGNRGLNLEYWDTQTFANNEEAITTTVASDGSIHLDETQLKGNEQNTKWTRMKFVFKAVWDGRHQFSMMATGGGALKAEGYNMVESSGNWAYGQIMDLTKGDELAVIAVAAPSSDENAAFVVRMAHLDTKFTNSWVGMAFDEQQRVNAESTVVLEQQTFTVSATSGSSTNEVQKVCSVTGEKTQLCLYGVCTAPAAFNAVELVAALNKLPFVETGESFTAVEADSCVTITFQSPRGNIPMMSAIGAGITITVETQGVASGDKFSFMYGGIPSPLIDVESDTGVMAGKMTEALTTMFSVRCPKRFLEPVNGYYQGFETGFSDATSEVAPFCGRYSLMNKQVIYPFGSEGNRRISGKHFCFAVKGLDNNNIELSFHYDGVTRRVTTAFTTALEENTWTGAKEEDNTWKYTCLNLQTIFTERWPSLDDYSMYVLTQAKLTQNNLEKDFYVDAVLVTSAPVYSTDDVLTGQRMEIAQPGNRFRHTMNEISVVYDEANSNYVLTLTPHSCGHGFSLLNVDEAQSSAVTISSSRVTRASEPVTGTYTLSMDGISSDSIPFDATDSDIEALMAGRFGRVKVERTASSTCANMYIDIKFLDKPGDLPQMTMDGEPTKPAGATARITDRSTGHLSLWPIPGDFAYSYHTTPQIKVFVNDVPTMCSVSSGCGFAYTSDKTPTVTAITPTSGNEGDSLTITGTKFSTTNSENTVTIGGVDCSVTAATATSITCDLGNGPLETFTVDVNVAGLGKATNTAPGFQYSASIATIDPTTSSLAGNVQLTVSGVGFSSASTVTVDGVNCPVTSIDVPTTIYCTVPPNSDLSVTNDQTVAVEVTIGSSTMSSSTSFVYTALNAQITSVTPQETLSVLGDQLIDIAGTDMGTSGSAFLDGEALEVVSWTATSIQLRTPTPTPFGTDLELLVQLGSQGALLMNGAIPTLSIAFRVDNIYPTSGSLNGGTRVTVSGDGFPTETSDIWAAVGDTNCTVLTATRTQVTCEIGSTSKTHKVDNMGTTGFGPYYAWSVTVLEAEVGQKVHWSWDTADFLNNITHRVVQIADLAKAEPLSGGISSGPASRKGEFIWEFTAPGEYHFWSGFVDVYDIKNYKMTVKVSEKTASIEPFSMLVADTEPEYKINSGVADPTDSSGCAMMTSGIAGCTLESLTAADSKKFNFRFTQCRTPTLTSVTFSDALSTLSRSATSNTIMSFSGTQFSNHDCANVVKIGDCECTVSSSTATSLDCSPNANCGYVVGLDQTFSVNVLQYGFAQNTISSLSAKTAVFVPSITSIEPTTGSAAGGTLVTIAGVGFDALEDIAVSFNGASAKCVSVNPLVCESPSSTTGQITATVSQFPATCPGTCMFTYSLDNTPTITAVEPTSVSGADTLTFTGTGFNEGTVTVEVGGEDCTPVTVNSDLEVTCDVTGLPAGDNIVKLRVGGKGYAQTSSKVSGTPSATVSPATGSTSGGTTLTFAGHGFSGETTVVAGDVSCIDVSVNSLSEITCVTESSTAGAVDWMITSNGEAFPAVSFTYDDSLKPTITSISPSSGDSLGDQLLTLAGSFFYEGVGVTVCGDACAVESVTDTEIVCLTPAKTDTSPCDVSVTESGSATSTAGTQYAFVDGDAPTITSVTPSRGGTGGGTTVTLAGTGLTGGTVDIGDKECSIVSSTDTQIVCTTASQTSTKVTKAIVTAGGKRSVSASSGSSTFYYVDAWSSSNTWGGVSIPQEGEFIHIPAGKTVLLDTNTPILDMLLIEGELICDDVSIELNANRILIDKGGLFQCGTAEHPHAGKVVITLYGHARDAEIPVFGTKVIGNRNGTLDLHGTAIVNTWTRLATTANAGDTTITIEDDISDWNVGDEIVIATTGSRGSEGETEKKVISAINGQTITLADALEFMHLGVSETFTGSCMEVAHYRAEVGLLTRSVVVRGNDDAQYHSEVEKCEAGFDAAEFTTQTCFQGRFGDETTSSQFGAQIMCAGNDKDAQTVVCRISYTEITFAGQAFRLGRYPIHFHLNGDMSRSYAIGNAIHKTFNRAINIHGSHNLQIERNVVYNVMGGALFLEDGIETNNHYRGNLVMFVIASSSLLNDDITPACYWVTNPNNSYVDNVCAGGTHFAFWFRFHEHPEGPSATTSYWIRLVPLLKFENNSAHSFSWFGIWIFPDYYPTIDVGSKPAIFKNFFAYNNEKGIEFVNVGGVQIVCSLFVQNTKSGVEIKQVVNGYRRDINRSTGVFNSTIVGKSSLAEVQNSHGTTDVAIVLPYGDTFYVVGTTFINFDSTSAVFKTAHIDGTCSDQCGSYIYIVDGLTFDNVVYTVWFEWTNNGVIEVLDGSFPGVAAGSRIVPGGETDTGCTQELTGYQNVRTPYVPALVCEETKKFHRFAFKGVSPSSVEGKDFICENENGETRGLYRTHRLTHAPGWMLSLMDGSTYFCYFENAEHMTNISMTATMNEIDDGDCVIMGFRVMEKPDQLSIGGSEKNDSDSFTCADDPEHGAWYYDSENTRVYFAVSGNTGARKKRGSGSSIGNYDNDKSLPIKIVKCFYVDCIPPIPRDQQPAKTERPDPYQLWHDPIWSRNGSSVKTDSTIGHSMPTTGEDVLITEDYWVVINQTYDIELGVITVEGGLEIDYLSGHVFVVKFKFLILLGGQLNVGWASNPMLSDVTFVMLGDSMSTPYTELAGYSLGVKAMGIYGKLEVYGKDIGKTFSLLTATATAGTSTLSVTGSEIANWSVGGEVVITSTALSPVEAETRTISAIDSDTGTITLSQALEYTHRVSSETFNGKVVSSVCAVAYTSRTVTFMGEETETNKLGGRILVSVTTAPGTSDTLTGSANMGNAAFKNMGQDGYTDPFDPRFGLALLATGPVTDKKFSKVYGNSFMNLDSTAIGAFGVSNLDIENNLIYHSNGIGLKLGGQTENTRVRNNIAMNLLWTGSYAGRAESTNIRQEALFDLYNSIDTDLQNNFAFGSQRAGFSLPGQLCEETYKPGLPNYAIGNQIGVWIGPNDDIQQSSSQTCVRFSDFVIMKSTYWSFYYNNHYSVEFENLILAENDGTLLPMVIGPNPLGHVCGDEYVKLSNSTVIGRLPGADCSSETSPFGTYMDLSGLCMQGTGPGGALLAVLFGQITGGSNNAPEKPCGNIMSYNTLCGRMEITDTTFANFGPGSSGCKDAYAFATNPKNDDLQYYATFLNSNRINIPDSHVFYFHRPNVGKINPADCVDMDCDALKKAMIIDEDGTLIGAPATLFPESEWEWDGDPRRGLGDFRVPKDSLTTVDGDVLSVEELAEKGKGIVRNDGCELKEYSNFAYWHCEDDAWELLVMESLDADTEMRRLSPVAVIQDGYIDLINGPQDHGWCSGYTCQKRVSAFHGIVKANSGIADIYLSSTQPDKMRFFKLDGADENCVVIRFYYLNPNRIDIYTDGGSNHVLPKNGWEDDGVFKFRNEPGVDYKPTCSDAHGSNYIDRVARQLYFVLKGNTDVRLTRANVVLVSLGLPGMSEEDFFGQNIIENLAAILGIPLTKVRVVEITSNSLRRRKRAVGTLEVVIEVGDAPPSSSSDSTESALDYAIYLMNACQSGTLDSGLGADDVTCDEILVGETTYSPAQPAGLQFMQTMTPQHEGVPFTMQPKIRAYDSNGDMIDNLGIEESPWEITASLRAGTGHSSAALSGTVTVASENGWVNFTDLQISHAGSGYIIDFEITAPAEAAYLNFSLSTDAFDLDAVPMTAGVYSMTTDDIISGETLAIVLNLRDSTTDVAIPDITWRDHTFNIACDTLIDFEDGSLTGTLSGTFVAGTGRVAFSDWSFTGYGLVYISCRTQSTPSEFDFYSYHSLTVLSPTQASIQIEATSIITLRFNNDYDTTLPTEAAAKQLEQETIAVFNQKFPDVIITDSSISPGSIIVAFTIEGASLNVSNVAEDICKDISSGTTVDIGGQTLTLDGYMLVDGEEFYSTCSSSDEEDGLHAAYIALIVILCLLIVGIVVFVLVYKFKIQPNSKTHGHRFEITPYQDNGRTVFLAGANHNVKEGFFKQRQNTGIRSEANVPPITTLYDETPGYLQVRKSPLEMDIERAVTPTD
ncbi:fibrocystin-L-like isoform X2 [Mya arenaria]|uniref:fibrocystin-L-like isoform X2 n=1 Tax=Mya arenaria TaxID=6604 RepID=UPI0022E5345A|nr:fibrocystin-L-like isoform X2 [Mya arenaria]